MNFDHYVYPGTNVLKNKKNIVDGQILSSFENAFVTRKLFRLQARGITGQFDVQHLKSIHKELFGDIYDWAGEFRDIQIYKGGTEFSEPDRINDDLSELFSNVRSKNYFKGLSEDEVVDGLSDTMCRLNMIHPFREGNGRTQRLFLSQMALYSDHDLDFSKVSENDMRNASFASARGNIKPMRCLFKSSIVSNISSDISDARVQQTELLFDDAEQDDAEPEIY